MKIGTKTIKQKRIIMTGKFHDHVADALESTIGLIEYIQKERSQMYGTIIYLMQLMARENIALPPIESMREYINSFMIMYDMNDEGEFYVKIVEKEDEVLSGPEDGVED